MSILANVSSFVTNLRDCLKLIEAYIMRMAVCGLLTYQITHCVVGTCPGCAESCPCPYGYHSHRYTLCQLWEETGLLRWTWWSSCLLRCDQETKLSVPRIDSALVHPLLVSFLPCTPVKNSEKLSVTLKYMKTTIWKSC